MRFVTTLGELCGRVGVQTGPFGSQLHAHEYEPEGIPVVMPQDIGDNIIRTESIARVPETVAQRLDRHRLREGDIVYSRRGDVERRALVRRGEVNWLCGTGCLRVRLDASAPADARFVSYHLGLPQTREWIVSHAVGGTMLNLNRGILAAVPVTLPELAEQRAIAEVLGALDDKIAANAVAARDATNLADSLYSRASTRVARVAASSVLTPVLGGTPDRSNANLWIGEVPWVSARDIAGAAEGIVLQTEESISTEAVSRSRAKPVPAGSVIMTARGTVGAVARLGIEAAFNQSCYAFVPVDGLPAACLYFMVKDAATDALSVSHGSVFSTITMRSFDALTVPSFPSEALGRLEAELSPLLDLVAARATESRHLAQLRDTLLPHLMSGRITVRQAELLVDASGLR